MKAKEEMKQQGDRERKKVEEQKKGDKVMLSTKDLVFKKQLARKSVNENLPDGECQSSSVVQRIGGETGSE